MYIHIYLNFYLITLIPLKNDDWKHLHLKTLELLRQMLKRQNIAELFFKDVSLDKFMEFVNTTKEHKNEAVGVLSELAGYEDARPVRLHPHIIEKSRLNWKVTDSSSSRSDGHPD